MFIAHIPAGYLTAHVAKRCGQRLRGLMAACLLGSIAPDFDLLYFYLADSCQHHHHSYFSHWPVVWISLLLLSLLWFILRKGSAAQLSIIFTGNALLHIALDGVVGDVQLLAPWCDKYYALATVPARYTPWWLNFILHWSMIVELIICATAGYFFLSSVKKKRRN